jgi:hypothetical protein
VTGIQVEIQFDNFHPRFAQKSKLAALRMLRDELAHVILRNVPLWGDPRNLEFRGGRRNMRIEPRTRLCAEIDGHRNRWVFRFTLSTSAFTRSRRDLFVSARLEAPLAVTSYPVPAFDGRE